MISTTGPGLLCEFSTYLEHIQSTTLKLVIVVVVMVVVVVAVTTELNRVIFAAIHDGKIVLNCNFYAPSKTFQ